MTIEELIKELQALPNQQAEVYSWEVGSVRQSPAVVSQASPWGLRGMPEGAILIET